jgi:hypothetical protein
VACRTGHHYPPPQSLITSSSHIALAEAVAIDPLDNGVRFRFRLIEALRGDVASEFSVYADAGAKWLLDYEVIRTNEDFGGHRDATSGQLFGGRTLEGTDCKIHPVFQRGGRYLLFLDELPNPWGSERIIAADDFWLAEVRRMIGSH